MNMRVQALIDQARVMTTEERIAVLDALQELVAPPDQQWEDAWAAESEDRLDAFQRGKLAADDFDVTMEQMRREFLGR